MATTTDTTLSRNADVRCTSIDKEAVLLNIAEGECYALNAVGARIWEILDQPMTVGQVCKKICDEFEIDPQSCEAALLKFTDEIIDIDIVRASND